MNHFYKTVLLWLLVAVLPLHAAAGTMSLSCGPIHHQAMQVALMDEAHHHHDASDPVHGQHHDATAMTSAAADSGDASSTQHHANCTACTATCISAAAPPSALFNSTPAFNGSEMVTVSPASLPIGDNPSGLERPPKHMLA